MSHTKGREEVGVKWAAFSGCGSSGQSCRSSPNTSVMESQPVGTIQLHHLFHGLIYPSCAITGPGDAAQVLWRGHIWILEAVAGRLWGLQPPRNLCGGHVSPVLPAALSQLPARPATGPEAQGLTGLLGIVDTILISCFQRDGLVLQPPLERIGERWYISIYCMWTCVVGKH